MPTLMAMLRQGSHQFHRSWFRPHCRLLAGTCRSHPRGAHL